MKKKSRTQRFYLVSEELGTLYTDDKDIAACAQEKGYRLVSAREYGRQKAKLGKDAKKGN